MEALDRSPTSAVAVEPGSQLTPLMLSCRDGHFAAAKCLILFRYKAEVQAKSKSGCTALSIAAEAGAADAVRILLEQGADLLAEDKFGTTVTAAPLCRTQTPSRKQP